MELNEGVRAGTLVVLRGTHGEMTGHLGSRRFVSAKRTGSRVFVRHSSLSSHRRRTLRSALISFRDQRIGSGEVKTESGTDSRTAMSGSMSFPPSLAFVRSPASMMPPYFFQPDHCQVVGGTFSPFST